jgi:2-haloacid dehalogenase
MNRKRFIQATTLASTSFLFSPTIFGTKSDSLQIKAVAFDAFSIFDPGPIFKSLHELIADKGDNVIELWQNKQFSYQWLRVCGNKYKNFWEVTKDALDAALAQSNVLLSDVEKMKIMSHYETISVWPEVLPVLKKLKDENVRLCILSNMTEDMLMRGLNNSNAEIFFDHVISTDEKRIYKPCPAAYHMAIEKLKLKKENILFVPFASWDMAGAKWYGYPTFWVNRLQAILDKLDATPDGAGNDLNDVVEFIISYNSKAITFESKDVR